MINKLKAMFGSKEDLKVLLSKNDISFDSRVAMWWNKNLEYENRSQNINFWIENKGEATEWLKLILKEANKEDASKFTTNQVCEMLSLLYCKRDWLDKNSVSFKEVESLWSKSDEGLVSPKIIKGLFDLGVLTPTLALITRYRRSLFSDLTTEGHLCELFEGTRDEQHCLFKQIFVKKSPLQNEHLLLCLFKNKTIDLDVLCTEKWEMDKNSWDAVMARAVVSGVMTSKLIEKSAPFTGPLWFLSNVVNDEVMRKVPTETYKAYYRCYKEVPLLENKIEIETLQSQFLTPVKKSSIRVL